MLPKEEQNFDEETPQKISSSVIALSLKKKTALCTRNMCMCGCKFESLSSTAENVQTVQKPLDRYLFLECAN